MSELRKDPISQRWVIIAAERGRRPSDFAIPPEPTAAGACPFCPGNERMTPPEILAVRPPGSRPDEPGWRLRVVSNKYPALRIEGDLDKRGNGIYDFMNGIGAHEVIIETPDHVRSVTAASVDQLEQVVRAYRTRLLDLKKDRRFSYGMVFKNVGAAAGASLAHTHSQLVVVPTVPSAVREEMSGAAAFYEYRGRCIYCDMVRQELEQRVRIVVEDDRFVAIAPFASRFAFETWLLPKGHQSHFENLTDADLPSFATLFRTALLRLETVLQAPPYNYIIHTTPFNQSASDAYHWHVEIIPRLTRVAGFEWGTGFYINPVPPEEAAGHLRQAEGFLP